MDVALVEDREDHVHHKHRESHQQRQTRDGSAERQRLTLQLCTNARRNYFARRLLDEIRRSTESHARLEVERERHARELIEVVHRLWTKRGSPGDQFLERHKPSAVVRLDIQQRKILGLLAHRIVHLENYLVLIVRLLDQVEIVLRVSIAQQRQYSRFRNAVRLRLVAAKVDIYVRRVVIEVG